MSLTRAITETHDHCQFRWLRNNDFVADHWRWQVKLVFSSATCLLAGWLAGCPCFLLEHCCFSQCYDHGYCVPFTTMKFWRNLLLSDCSRTWAWACCCEPSVNHVNLPPPLRKSCNQVVKALWLWQSATWAEDMYIYIYLYVFERGAGALGGSAPALPPTTTTGGAISWWEHHSDHVKSGRKWMCNKQKCKRSDINYTNWNTPWTLLLLPNL